MKNWAIGLSLSMVVLGSAIVSGCREETSDDPVYPESCANFLVGIYAGSDYCASTGQSYYSCNITSTTPTNITLSNLGGMQVNAIADCAKNTLTIPTQTIGNYSVSGSGTYTANRIVINWSGITAGVLVNCSTTFTR